HVVHEQSVPGPDGQRVWIEITANPIRDEKRNIVAASELSVYVNERKQLENKLREAEKRYHALFDKAPLGILIIDSNATAVEFNEEAHRQLGYSREEFEKLTVSDYEVLESAEETTAHMKKILKTGKDEFETKHRTKMGEIRDIINTVQVIELSGKKFLHVITRDITEQKKAEEALRESEKEKSVVLDSMSELVSHQDLKHRILWANKKAADSVNMKVEQLKGHYCHEIWANSVNPCTDCPLEETIKTGQPQQGEITTPDGRVWSISGYPIKDTNGNVTSIVEVATEITTQKKTEEALRESEKKYRELLNGMNDTAWVIDLDGNIIDVNDVAVEVLGYSRDEFRSIGLTGIDSNLDPEEIKGLVEGMPADEIQVFETAHTTKDGKKIPVEISSSLVTYRGKQAILCIARDITERKRAEEKLSQSEERYRTVFENTGTAMCILEEDKTISMVNKRFEELSGYSWKELEGKKWTELVTKEYLERMKRYHEARRKKGGKPPAHYNFDFVNKKGQIRNSMLTINLIPGTKKSIASIQDITEQKKTEKALQEAEEKYQKAIVNANVGIIGYSPDGEVKILNPKMEQMTGFKRSEIPTLQDWFKKLYPNEEERRKVRDKWFKRMSEEGEVKGGHAIIATKDGKRRNFLFNGVQLESGDSIAFADDITERKEAEEKLEGMMNEVVTINEKLGVVGRLTRHDARNKLSVIANNVYLAKQRLAGNNNALDYLGDIESAIGQMEEIFDFARTYEMLGVEDLSYVDVEKSVKEAAMLFSGLDGAKLVNECHGLTVLADSLLRQLFYNLIDDTLKHGETVSQIRVYYKEVGEDRLKLVYEDDGVGIPEDEKEKIFGEGYGKGTGYGLYLIRKICEAYGWTIQETGKPGKGAQFTITIPKPNKNGKTAYTLH
ncbi:PAS domain S-box protein, partial [bacterium]